VEELCQHRWIATSWQQQKMSILQLDSNESLTIKLSQFAQTNTLTCTLEMARRHLGIVLLPDVVARPLLKTGELVHILDRITGPRWPVHTLHAYKGDKPVYVTRFHQLVCRFFTEL